MVIRRLPVGIQHMHAQRGPQRLAPSPTGSLGSPCSGPVFEVTRGVQHLFVDAPSVWGMVNDWFEREETSLLGGHRRQHGMDVESFRS